MSASSNDPIVLSGDFIEVSEVTDVGTDSETETVVAATMGEIALEKDNEAVEANLHQQALTVRNRTHYTLDTSFTATVIPGMPQLETAGIVDENGDPTGGTTWECARFNIYENEPTDEDTPDAVFEAYNVSFDFEDITLGSGDPGEINFVGFVSGGWHIGSSAPTTTTTS